MISSGRVDKEPSLSAPDEWPPFIAGRTIASSVLMCLLYRVSLLLTRAESVDEVDAA